jgi:alkylated DNA nucleotide flippase Atl1
LIKESCGCKLKAITLMGLMESNMGLFGDLRGLAKLVGIGEVAKLVGEAAVETMTGKPIVNERKELTPHDQAYAEKQYQLALATKEGVVAQIDAAGMELTEEPGI